MSATLYLSPTTDATLAHIVEHVRLVRHEHPLAPMTFLLPTGDAIRQLRRTLGNVIGVRFHQFYNLSAAVLSEAGSGTHEMSDLATRRLVRAILAELQLAGLLTTFVPMLDKPGFVDVVVEWLREMKTQGIAPQAVSDHASQSGKPRDLQLAALYARYQEALRQADCADADGLLWLVAESLERDAALLAGIGELGLAGFDQFSPIQLRMVAALAARAPVSIYLLWDPARPATSLALGRLAPTRDALLRALAPREVPLFDAARCGPALAHLRKALFESERSASADETNSIAPAACRAIAAPSPEAEVRHALRRIKRLLLDGVREEQIALAAPRPGSYRALVSAVGREYGVPVACETTLGENPCVAALLNLLLLSPAFLWRQTFDALRSPYVKQPWLDTEQIACLDALTRERPVVAGQDQWWYALGKGEDPQDADGEMPEDEDRADPPLLSQLEPEALATLQAGLAAFFDQLTPPAEATHAGYVSWIQEALLGLADDQEPETGGRAPCLPSLGIVESASEGEWADRDRGALGVLLQALRTWLDAVALTGELGLEGNAGRVTTWAEFGADLLEWLPAVPVPPDHAHAAVRFGPLEMNRAVTVEHLFVLGLGEGEFPRQPQPDPFYTAAERAAHPLPLVQVASAEDASLWWQVLCNCQCSLTLLRSRYDPNGAEWLPSAYWSAVLQLVDGLEGRVETPGLGYRPEVEDAACPGELLEALACSRASGAPESLATAWNAMQAAQVVARVRDSWGALGGHEGVVADEGVAAHLRSRYGPGRPWSLSRLNRYGICPYAFWAQQALELKALTDPSEGMDAMQRGSLIHKLLEKLFARLAAANLAPGPDTLDPIRGLLDEVCDQVFPGATKRYGFRPGPLWEHEQSELRAELHAYTAWECEPEQSAGFRPYRQELKFGAAGCRMDRGTARVAVPGLEGAAIALRGVIDRVDRDNAGHLRVIDYKSGGTRYTDKDIAAGRALQTALYAWVVEAILPGEGVVVDSAYRHTGSRCQSGRIRSSSAHESELIRQTAAKAVSMAGSAAQGWFPASPSKGSGARACDERCDYLGLCRVTRHGARKAQRAGLPLVGQAPGANDDPGNDGGRGGR